MLRARFTTNDEDYRPVVWPIKHPYWCTGYSMRADDTGRAVLVAYVDDEAELLRNWPDAEDIDAEPAFGYQFTSRFRKPDWFVE